MGRINFCVSFFSTVIIGKVRLSTDHSAGNSLRISQADNALPVLTDTAMKILPAVPLGNGYDQENTNDFLSPSLISSTPMYFAFCEFTMTGWPFSPTISICQIKSCCRAIVHVLPLLSDSPKNLNESELSKLRDSSPLLNETVCARFTTVNKSFA